MIGKDDEASWLIRCELPSLFDAMGCNLAHALERAVPKRLMGILNSCQRQRIDSVYLQRRLGLAGGNWL